MSNDATKRTLDDTLSEEVEGMEEEEEGLRYLPDIAQSLTSFSDRPEKGQGFRKKS
jgi:hypothetical protein